jgi:hypothetical protein
MHENERNQDGERTREELEQRVDRLESMVAKMAPGRRDLLKAGVGVVAGGALVGAGSSPAAAATTFVEVDEVRDSGGTKRIGVGSTVDIPGPLSVDEVNNGGSPVDLGDFLNRLDVSKGGTTELWRAIEGTDNGGGAVVTQPTDSVSTSATTILDASPNAPAAFLVVIVGWEDGDTSGFQDVLAYTAQSIPPSVILSDGVNSPDGRTYTRSGNQLQLAMAANSYDVAATGIGARRDFNATS